jgi:hypothetical protein
MELHKINIYDKHFKKKIFGTNRDLPKYYAYS